MSSDKKELKRRLGFWDSVAINVGVVIGVGIFRTPGTIAHYVDSSPLILAVWIIGAFVALLGVLCYAELSSCLPHTGGTYVYLREAFGRQAGFIFGWAEFSILRAGSIAGVAYIFTDYLRNFLPFLQGYERGGAIAAIFIFTVINAVGIHTGTRVQNTLSLLKVAAIVTMAGIIFKVSGFPFGRLLGVSGTDLSKISGLAPALIPVLWTYGGWHQSTFMSGEFKDTRKTLPLSLVTGIFAVAALYLLMNAAYLTIFLPAEMAGTKTIASDIFGRLYGDTGKWFVTVAVLISAGGALNSTIMTGGRIPFAVAADHPKLSLLAHIDPKFGTPFRSLFLNAAWASALVLWGNFEQLLFFFAFANWFFFALVGLSVFQLRRKSPLAAQAENYAMIGYPWVPGLFILSSLILCGITISSAPRESLLGTLLLMTGFPVYAFFKGSRNLK